MKNIAILSMAYGDEYRESVLQCINNHKEYADRYRYFYHCETGDMINPDKRHPAWSKLLIVNEFIQQFEYVFWVDADTLFMNHTCSMKKFTRYDWVFSADPNYPICSGVWGVIGYGYYGQLFDRRARLMDWYNAKENDSRLWEQRAMINDLPPSDEMVIDQTLAGFYNTLPKENYIDRKNMDSTMYTKEQWEDAFRSICFDPTYHHICHFAGRSVENKGLKQCIEKMLPKVRR